MSETSIRPHTLLELRHWQCRWPSGDRVPYHFCGSMRVGQSSYCSEHRKQSLAPGSQPPKK